jgi:enhancer of polycomb-like protein
VEQSIEGFLLNGVSYDIDERGVVWLDKHNSPAKGEGMSSGAGSPDRSWAAKMRGKDVATEQPSFVIPENEFEFAMGLFQKITDEKCPYLHLVCSVSLPSARVTNSHA